MLSVNEIEARIDQSAMMLDRLEPNWRSRIDLKTLNVADAACCVVGQLSGTYARGRTYFLERGAVMHELGGFESHGPRETSATEFRMLTAGWRDYIKRTLAPAT